MSAWPILTSCGLWTVPCEAYWEPRHGPAGLTIPQLKVAKRQGLGAGVLIFLDTEYTDEHRRELVSIGMVSEDGQHSIYLECADYSPELCSKFMRRHVMPHLGRERSRICTQSQLAQRLRDWFRTLPRSVQLASDSTIDRDLLLNVMGGVNPGNVNSARYDLRPLIDTTVFHRAVEQYHQQSDHPWHHALHDARAHRAGWLAWMDLNRIGKA